MGKFETIIEARSKLYAITEQAAAPAQATANPELVNYFTQYPKVAEAARNAAATGGPMPAEIGDTPADQVKLALDALPNANGMNQTAPAAPAPAQAQAPAAQPAPAPAAPAAPKPAPAPPPPAAPKAPTATQTSVEGSYNPYKNQQTR